MFPRDRTIIFYDGASRHSFTPPLREIVSVAFKTIQLEINNSRSRALLKLLSPRNKLIVSWTLAPDVSFPLDSGNKILIARPLEKKGQDRKNLKRIKKKLGPVEAGGESRSVKFLSMRLVS